MTDPVSTWLAGRAGAHGAVILMYHSIVSGDATPAWPWAVNLETFRRQLDLLAATGWKTATMAQLADGSVPLKQKTLVITFDDGYENNLFAVEELAIRHMCATWFVVTGSIGKPPAWEALQRPTSRLLNAAELRQMRDCGMEIGSHTVSHLRLTTLDETRANAELRDSRCCLEDLLGHKVTSFAYPYGAHSDAVVHAVRRAGYLAACTTRTGWAMRDRDPFRLRRLTVFNHDTASSLSRKLYLGTHEVGWPEIVRYLGRRLMARLGA